MPQEPPDHNPYASPESPETFARPQRSSFALTAVALLNYVLGTMTLMCGGCLADFAAPGNAEGLAGIPGGMIVVLGVGLVLIFLSLPAFLAGFGIQRRKQWGRVLTIILGVLSGILGLLSGGLAISPITSSNPEDFYFVSWHISLAYGGYAIFVIFILLQPKYAAEFRLRSPSEGE